MATNVRYLYLRDYSDDRRVLAFSRRLNDGVVEWSWCLNKVTALGPNDCFSKKEAHRILAEKEVYSAPLINGPIFDMLMDALRREDLAKPARRIILDHIQLFIPWARFNFNRHLQ